MIESGWQNSNRIHNARADEHNFPRVLLFESFRPMMAAEKFLPFPLESNVWKNGFNRVWFISFVASFPFLPVQQIYSSTSLTVIWKSSSDICTCRQMLCWAQSLTIAAIEKTALRRRREAAGVNSRRSSSSRATGMSRSELWWWPCDALRLFLLWSMPSRSSTKNQYSHYIGPQIISR